MNLDDVRADIAAFADDDDDVAVEYDGSFLFIRNGQEVSGRVRITEEGRAEVEIGDSTIPYRRFLTHYLGRLDIFAERLLEKRAGVSPFIEGPAEVRRATGEVHRGSSIELLDKECREAPAFSARVAFITADAGHGKTWLLREYQSRQARAFSEGRASSLFWHLDLQGRQLLRLSEALMGDLGELRLIGLWMPGIIRLLRHRALVIAIDGFDELAAEQGGADALGALATLVNQLEGQGVLIAASRRTFFETEDYLKRSGMLRRAVASPCEFERIALDPWTRVEGLKYLEQVAYEGHRITDATKVYEEISSALGAEHGHPMISRPFLLAQVVRALLRYDLTAAQFMRADDDPLSGVAAVIKAFVEREVLQKWKYVDTGEPYLTFEQHMQLLADIAEEMHRDSKDRLSIDIIQTIATILLDSWQIDPNKRQQVLDMVKAHVLLVIPPDARDDVRSFDHPEFRDYFIAIALRNHLERASLGEGGADLARYLSISQLSDSTARYVCAMLPRSPATVSAVLDALLDEVRREWRATSLQVNSGTLIPFLLNGVSRDDEPFMLDAKIIYSSLVFEHNHLKNVVLTGGTFVNVSLQDVNWEAVQLVDCSLGEIAFSETSSFRAVEFIDCKIDGVRIYEDGAESAREYAPHRILRALAAAGIEWRSEAISVSPDDSLAIVDTALVKQLRRLLRLFSRSTVVTEQTLKTRFGTSVGMVTRVAIPLLEKHGIIKQEKWRGGGTQQLWLVQEQIDDVLSAESGMGKPNLVEFWRDAHQAS